MAKNRKFITPITIVGPEGKTYQAGTEVTMPSDEADAFIARFGEGTKVPATGPVDTAAALRLAEQLAAANARIEELEAELEAALKSGDA